MPSERLLLCLFCVFFTHQRSLKPPSSGQLWLFNEEPLPPAPLPPHRGFTGLGSETPREAPLVFTFPSRFFPVFDKIGEISPFFQRVKGPAIPDQIPISPPPPGFFGVGWDQLRPLPRLRGSGGRVPPLAPRTRTKELAFAGNRCPTFPALFLVGDEDLFQAAPWVPALFCGVLQAGASRGAAWRERSAAAQLLSSGTGLRGFVLRLETFFPHK